MIVWGAQHNRVALITSTLGLPAPSRTVELRHDGSRQPKAWLHAAGLALMIYAHLCIYAASAPLSVLLWACNRMQTRGAGAAVVARPPSIVQSARLTTTPAQRPVCTLKCRATSTVCLGPLRRLVPCNELDTDAATRNTPAAPQTVSSMMADTMSPSAAFSAFTAFVRETPACGQQHKHRGLQATHAHMLPATQQQT